MFKKILIIFCILIFANSVEAKIPNVNTDFFTNFGDEYLNSYIKQTLENNHDLKQTIQNIEKYRQQVKYNWGAEMPILRVSANYLGIHVPKLDDFNMSKSAFILPFIANWESDIFLKNYDKIKSSKKAYEAELLEQKSVYIALLSDVTVNYINILQYDYLINSQNEIVEIKGEKLLRAKKELSQGVVDKDYVESINQDLKKENNALNDLQKQREVTLNLFATLIGISPNEIVEIKRGILESFEYKKEIPEGIESDVIFSRPDVLKAEKNLEKMKIDVRVARKEFLPTFNITGLWAFNTLAAGSFFSWESSLATLMAGTTQDIFMGGRKIANLKIQKAEYERVFEQYKQTNLNAVKEVNTALCYIKYDSSVEKNTLEQLNSQNIKYVNNKKRYNQGLISYPEMLVADENLIKQKQNIMRSKTARLIDYITLYKAVGGEL